MNEDDDLELDFLDGSIFDDLVRWGLDESTIPEKANDVPCLSDLYLEATPKEQEAALKLFRGTAVYYVQSFKSLVTGMHSCFGEELLRLPISKKLELLQEFGVAHLSKSLANYVANPGKFPPLFLTGWSDGLAVAVVRNEQQVRRILSVLLHHLFHFAGMPKELFLSIGFNDRLIFCEVYRDLLLKGIDILVNLSPEQFSSDDWN